MRIGVFVRSVGWRLQNSNEDVQENFFTLRKHSYSNILKFSPPKTESFQIKNLIFFIFLFKTDCGYSLEPPRRGGSNEYPQSMFLSRNKKHNAYPCKSQFYYIKVGFKGSKLYRHVFVMICPGELTSTEQSLLITPRVGVAYTNRQTGKHITNQQKQYSRVPLPQQYQKKKKKKKKKKSTEHVNTRKRQTLQLIFGFVIEITLCVITKM